MCEGRGEGGEASKAYNQCPEVFSLFTAKEAAKGQKQNKQISQLSIAPIRE